MSYILAKPDFSPTGEGVAFLIGWNLILEYAIGTASVARGYSGYLDSLLNKSMETALTNAMPINVSHF
jgi:solute carrier family 7 (cationic amino acid transporter), member 3